MKLHISPGTSLFCILCIIFFIDLTKLKLCIYHIQHSKHNLNYILAVCAIFMNQCPWNYTYLKYFNAENFSMTSENETLQQRYSLNVKNMLLVTLHALLDTGNIATVYKNFLHLLLSFEYSENC